MLLAVNFETWTRENLPLVALLVLVLVAALVARMIVKATIRIVALGAIAALALFISAERTEIRRCGETCKCELATIDVSVPFCRTTLL